MIHNEALIGCVGMTHLGINYSAAFASRGYHCICYDEDDRLILDLHKEILPIEEPGLEELINKNRQRLDYTSDVKDLRRCQLVFIAYDVPTDDKGNSHLEVIQRLIDKISQNISKTAYMILLSQVPPGFMRKINFDKERLFYQVETLIFGRAVERACFPERYIVGQNDTNDSLPAVYVALLEAFNCPILKMCYESAELTKIAINMFLVSSVSTTNTLAELSEKIGANWQEIMPALRLDKRIGAYAYLSPGLGITGGNLERDLATVVNLSEEYKTNASVVKSWISYSHYCREWVWRCLQRHIFKKITKPHICILGVAYKPGTHSIKNSQSIALINKLEGGTISIHDPVVEINHKGYKKTIIDAVFAADVVIIMTPWNDYKQLNTDFFEKYMRGDMIIDPYRVLNMAAKASDFNYYTIGHAPTIIQELSCSII